MDIFDQYLYDEITDIYKRNTLSTEEYEEIYQRFKNLEYIPEIKPYLYAMKYLGLGTKADPEGVLAELRELITNGTASICGLYFDLLLFKNKNDAEASRKLLEMAEKGYSDIYLKSYSHLCSEKQKRENLLQELLIILQQISISMC